MSLSTREADSLAIVPLRELTTHGERTVRTSIPTLDAFFGGLRPGNVTLLDSSDRMLFDPDPHPVRKRGQHPGSGRGVGGRGTP